MILATEFKALISQPDEINQICKTALENWRAIFNKAIFIDNLTLYQESVQNHNHQEQMGELGALFKYFKEVRKAAQYLRTTYLIFDRAHEEPESFHTFVWNLGQLKDTFWIPEKSNAHVSILANLLSFSANWEDFTIRPDSIEMILVYAKQPLDRARALVEQGELPAEDFHHLRKKLRLFANIYTLAVKYGRLGKVKEMKDLLVEINDELGDINDEMVNKSLLGEKRYEENVVSLGFSLAQKITALLTGTNNS